jgi:uroporphyrinogen decarboxylase
MRQPDYNQLLKVLRKQAPDRPVLFEFFLNETLYKLLGEADAPVKNDGYDHIRRLIYAYKNAGYDYVTVPGSRFGFPGKEKTKKSTYSLNDGVAISDRESYEAYNWPDPDDYDNGMVEKCAAELPEGMKFIVYGPCGVLENVISLVGYENLCIMLYDDPLLARRIFDDVGSRLVRYYEQIASHDSVCALISNDDWGFKTQTMLSPADMRGYVFPWHKKIVAVGHTYGKPVILHSFGQLNDVMEDVIQDMAYDAKHSFEDAICPIEEAYEMYKGRIALLGGLDLHFLCTSAPEAIQDRARRLIRQTADGGYALGTGNSVPEYVSVENYLAMVDVVRKGEC